MGPCGRFTEARVCDAVKKENQSNSFALSSMRLAGLRMAKVC